MVFSVSEYVYDFFDISLWVLHIILGNLNYSRSHTFQFVLRFVFNCTISVHSVDVHLDG